MQLSFLLPIVLIWYFFFNKKTAPNYPDTDYYNIPIGSGSGGTLSNTNQPTISHAQADSYATQLLSIMDSFWWSDNDEIKRVLINIGTEANLMLVSQKFGVKPYSISTGNSPIFDWNGEDLNLIQWLNYELEADLPFLKNQFPNVF